MGDVIAEVGRRGRPPAGPGAAPAPAPGRPAAGRARAAAPERTAGGWVVVLFLVLLAVPVVMHLGPLRLAPYRILLLAAFVPLVVMWLSGKAGRIRLADVMIALYAAWGALALVVVHGVGAQWQASGIFVAEALTPYLMARVLIRNAEDFTAMARWLLLVIAALVPFVWIEAATGYRLISEALRGAFAVYGIAHQEMRWGMTRAQGPFEHPILLGVFCSAGFALFYYVWAARRGRATGLQASLVSAVGTFFCLSMGAYLSVMVQVALMLYDRFSGFLKNRWKVLIYSALGIFLFLEVASNRGAVIIFIDTFTFNPAASWMRIAVNEHATAEALRNPVFGIGFNEFPRPRWVSWSIDNFWLLNMVRHGVPALAFLTIGLMLTLRAAAVAGIPDPLAHGCRMGWLIAMAGLCAALFTVHVWNATFAFFMFLIGAGAWMAETPAKPPGRRAAATRTGRAPGEGPGEEPCDSAPAGSDAGDAASPAPGGRRRPPSATGGRSEAGRSEAGPRAAGARRAFPRAR